MVQPCFLLVRFFVYNTGLLVKNRFPAVIYLLFVGFGLAILMYIFFTRISILVALLVFRMGNSSPVF